MQSKFFLALLVAVPGFAGPQDFVNLKKFDYRIVSGMKGPCLLRKATAEALTQAQATFGIADFRLKVFECYRPKSESEPHAKGTRVAVTLVDTAGKELAMPSRYLAPEPDSKLPDKKRAKRNHERLREAMEKVAFQSFGDEWWRYELKKNDFPDEDFALSAIK